MSILYLLAISGLLNGAGALFIGLLIVFKRERSNLHRIFALLNLAIAIWALSYWRWLLADNYTSALFWARMLSIGSTLIPIFFLHWILTLVGLAKKKKILLWLGYLMTIIFLGFSFSPYFVKTVESTFNFPYWPKPGILYHFYVFFSYLALLTYGVYRLFKGYREATGYRKAQMKYVFFGLAIAAPAGFTNFPLWYNINISPYGNFFVLAYVICYGYAMLRYRLMDIRVVMGKGAIYVFSFLSVIGASFLLIFLNQKLAQPISFNVFFPLTIIVAVLLFKLFFWFFGKLASKYFYYTFYSYQTVLTDLGRRLTEVLELKKLSALIASTLIRTIKLDRVVILLRDPETGDYQIQKNIGFREENGISLVRDNFLTRYLGKTQKPLVYEEISLIIRDSKDEREKRSLENLKKNMKKIEAALCLPLFREKKIIGMIVLGNKISGDPYSQQDLELLTTLSSQASIALENAALYNQVQDFSQNLQQKVDEQTRELRQAYEELKKLDKAKSEFISIASHQLRTPLAAIKGYISMILEGDYGKLPGKATKSMENVYQSNERLIKLVNGLLNISRIESGRIEIKKQKISLESLINSLIEELNPQAKEKKIWLKLEKPKTKLPQILADKEKLRQVLLNVLDNGIRYTTKGGIIIKLKIKNQKSKIIISDTGEGMSKDELSKIFQTFSRGKAGAKFWVEGVGLGLYIAKRFMELQGGKIYAKSSGKGKGSTFFVELPIK